MPWTALRWHFAHVECHEKNRLHYRLHYRLFQDILPFVPSVTPWLKISSASLFSSLALLDLYNIVHSPFRVHSIPGIPTAARGRNENNFLFKTKVFLFSIGKGKKKEPSRFRLCLPWQYFQTAATETNRSVSYFNCINPTWIHFIKPVSIQMCINILSTFIYKRKNEPTVSSQIKKKTTNKAKSERRGRRMCGLLL